MEETTVEELLQRFKELETQFEIDCDISHNLDTEAINIPKKLFKYIAHYKDLMFKINGLEDSRQEMYHHLMMEYKRAENELADYTWTNDVLKKMIDSHPDMRQWNKDISNLSSALKTTETMIEVLKSQGFTLKTAVDYKKFVNGN